LKSDLCENEVQLLHDIMLIVRKEQNKTSSVLKTPYICPPIIYLGKEVIFAGGFFFCCKYHFRIVYQSDVKGDVRYGKGKNDNL